MQDWQGITKQEIAVYIRIGKATNQANKDMIHLLERQIRDWPDDPAARKALVTRYIEREGVPAVQVACRKCGTAVFVLPLIRLGDGSEPEIVSEEVEELSLAIDLWNGSQKARTCPSCGFTDIAIPPAETFDAMSGLDPA